LGAAAVALVLGAGSAQADADSITDLIGPRALGLGEALRAEASGAAGTVLNPAGVGLTKGMYVIEGAYGFRNAEDGTAIAISVCDTTTSRVSACLYYDYFSSTVEGGESAMHQAGLTSAIPLGEMILFGVTSKYVDYEESGALAMPEDNSRDDAFMVDAGLIVMAHPMLKLALVGHNVVGSDEDNFPRAVAGGVALRLVPKLMVSGDGRWNIGGDETSGRYGAGLELFLQPNPQAGVPIRGGFVYDEATEGAYASLGLGYMTQRVALDIGARRQVSGGDELMVQFGLRFFMPPR
jgi:hypothetical protein